jgi:glycosyltransferase involved in cell wall biosynthesis
MRKLKKISIIVPCFNEQEVIESTHQRLTSILKSLIKESKCQDYEIVYVNDGSRDQTQKILENIFATDKKARIVVLRRNFGLQGALSAGLCLARGDATVTIDADLQDPPEKIGEMINFYEEGYDLVLGVREDRQTDTFFKRSSAEGFYYFLKIMGVEVVPNHGDFRLMARPLVDEFNAITERNRFIRAMVLTLDNHYACVFYKREPRLQGVTKFNFLKMLSFSLDGILSFTFVPLRLVFFIGVIFCLFAMAGGIFIYCVKLSGKAVPGWTSTVLPLFIFSGLQMFCLGIIGEYVSRLYIEAKQRPLFIVRQELTHSKHD